MLFPPLFSYGVNPDFIDRSVVVRAPADLYRFANGAWLDKAKLTPGRSWIGAYDDVAQQNYEAIGMALAQVMVGDYPTTSPEGTISLMLRQGMDAESANRLGVKPLRSELTRIDKISDRAALLAEIARLGYLCEEGNGYGSIGGFIGGASSDIGDPNRTIFRLGQCNLLLFDQRFYRDDDKAAKDARRRLVESESRLLTLAGYKNARSQAESCVALERELANVSLTPEQLRDIGANHHVVDQTRLQALTPHLPWKAYFAEQGIPPPAKVDVGQPQFFQSLDGLMVGRPLAQWRSYLRCSLLAAYAFSLSDQFADANQVRISVMSGQRMTPDRMSRTFMTVTETLGPSIARLCAKKEFKLPMRAKVNDMVENLRAILDERLKESTWMGEQTRAEARKKLAAMAVKLGYPDRWPDPVSFPVQNDSFAADLMRIRRTNWQRELARLGRPIDRSEWGISPTIVNAYFHPVRNEIVIPAGIVQVGFFDLKADDACNYGALGAIIGHEITHGFDDQGSQFDAAGRWRSWWVKEDRDRYEAATKAIVAQYDMYRGPQGQPVNGRLTLGENMADIGGLSLAYAAYHRALNGAIPPMIDGLTGDQRFFVAFAQANRSLMSAEKTKVLAGIDTHSPQMVRVEGAVADLPEFYKAFDLPVPENLPHVW